MSKTIDEKVVEMKFDNRDFERNTRTTMSTLEKLKEKLNLTGASKGLENINTTASKFNMNGMSSAIDTVQSKFSALEVMGVTALVNITNSAVNAGKKIVSALTIDPVKTGLQEYETQINAVQTILANTQKEGTDVKRVNAALDELNAYADKTIYNFTEMTRNIGTFTAAGVKLDTSVSAIKGIANLAAVSGSTSLQASTAMYQLSQALAAGTVKLMDWNSVVNAGMGGQVFQDSLMETARVHGVAIDDMIKKEGSFRETLQNGWLTSEILTETLEKYTYDVNEMTEAEKERTTAMLKSKGYTDQQIQDIYKMGQVANEAATKVKTFSQLWDVLKEAAQSGWAQSWRIIIGDFEEAKALLTPLAEFFQKIIDGISNTRNKILESALGRSFKSLFDNVQSMTKPVQEAVKSLQDYAKVVDEIIGGKWGNGQKRWDALAQSGYDWAHAQNLVNEKLGCSLRRATDYKETQDEITESQESINEATADYIIELTKMSDAELKAKGYTDEQIKSLRELEKVANKLGMPLDEFISKIDEINGRWILIESFKNIGKSLVSIGHSVKQAWNEAIYGTNDTDEIIKKKADSLFNLIAAFHKLSRVIKDYVEGNAENLTRTLRGLFSILGFISDIVGGGLKIGFLVLKEILKAFGYSVNGILDVTAVIGDAIYNTRQWIKEHNFLAEAIGISVKYIKIAVDAIKEWIRNNETIQNSIEKVKDKIASIKESLKAWIDGLKETDNIPKYIIEGLVNGLKNGGKLAIDAIIGLGKSLLEGIKNVLGIHSPSVEFFNIGQNIIQGLINGLQNGASNLWAIIKGIGIKCIEIFQSIDFGKLFAAGIGVGMLVVAKKMVDVISDLSKLAYRVTAPLKGLGDALSGLGSYFADSGKAKKVEAYGKVVRNMALSIGILAASVYVLSKIETEDLWKAVGVIAVLSVIVGGLYALVALLSKDKNLKDTAKTSLSIGSLIGITASLFIAAMALKKLGDIDIDNSKAAIINLTAVVVALGALIWVIGKSISPKQEKEIKNVGKMIRQVSMALLLLVAVVKLSSMLKPEEIRKGVAVIATFELLILGLVAISKLGGKHADKAGKMISRISVSLLLMIGAVKLAATLKPNEIAKGLTAIAGISAVFAALIAVSKFAGKNAAKAGWMMLGMSASFAIVVFVMKQITSLSDGEIKRGLTVVKTIGLIFTALIAVSNLAGKNAIKAGAMLIMMSTSLLMLTGVLFILSKMDPDGLGRALGIVSVLEILFGGLIAVTYLAKDCMKTLITITACLTILIAAVIGLSFIDSTKLATATASISAIMATLALLVASTKSIGNPKDVTLTLLPLVGAVGILAIIIALLSNIDPVSALASAGSLSMLLLSMSGALAIMSAVGPLAKDGLISLAAMELAVAGLAVIVGILGNNIEPEKAIATSVSLSILLLSMSGALAILSVVGAAWPAALAGIGCLDAFIIAVGGLIVGLGALVDKFPKLEEFLNKGIPILEKIGYALGSFFGNIVGGFLDGVSNALPAIGENLSKFMESISGFIEGARSIDESVVKGVGYLSLAIMAISGAELIAGITSFLSGNFSLATFGTQLSSFMENASGFINGISGINPEVAQGAKNLADAILAITGANLLQSITSWLTGGSSLADFGEQLGSLGTNLRTFVDSLGEFSEGQVTTVDCAGRAIKALAQAAQEIPNEGGWLGKILGENSIGAFGAQLPVLGTNLNQFVTNLGTFTDAQVTTVDCAGKAIKALAQAASQIPNEGGWAAAILGDNSISTFGSKLPQLGIDLSSFVTNLGTFSDAQVTTVDCAGKAIKTLADAANKIPNEGGLWAKICGDNSLATFGSKLPGLATNIKDFVANLGTFNDGQVTTVNSACNAIRSIAKLGEIDIKNTGDGLNSFGSNMVKFAKKVKEFVDNIGNVGSDGIDSAIKKTKELVEMAQTVASSNIDSIKTFGESLKKFAKDGVEGFVKEFSGESPKSKAKKAVKDMIDSGIKGADEKKKDVKNKFVDIAKEAEAGLKDESVKNGIKQVGKDFVSGFANGIKENKSLAINAGSEIGKAALKAAKEAIDSNSPSKETHKLGNYFGQGFVIGIKDYASKAYDVAHDVGELAKDGMSRAIAKISNVINSDIDAQPTIRPVLDLSDIESGAGYLNSMFNNGPSLAVASNLGSISYGMNARLQNGANDDVISAINKLRKDLSNAGGDTYNINGITYDDGSNISEAVGTLIRAAKVERRV